MSERDDYGDPGEEEDTEFGDCDQCGETRDASLVLFAVNDLGETTEAWQLCSRCFRVMQEENAG